MGEDRGGDTERDSPYSHLVLSLGGAEVLMLITFLGRPLLHVLGSEMRLRRPGGSGLEGGVEPRSTAQDS